MERQVWVANNAHTHNKKRCLGNQVGGGDFEHPPSSDLGDLGGKSSSVFLLLLLFFLFFFFLSGHWKAWCPFAPHSLQVDSRICGQPLVGCSTRPHRRHLVALGGGGGGDDEVIDGVGADDADAADVDVVDVVDADADLFLDLQKDWLGDMGSSWWCPRPK